MKIADVKIQVFKRDIPIPDGIDLSHEGVSFMDSLAEIPVVRIFTDEGIEGKSPVFHGILGLGMRVYSSASNAARAWIASTNSSTPFSLHSSPRRVRSMRNPLDH